MLEIELVLADDFDLEVTELLKTAIEVALRVIWICLGRLTLRARSRRLRSYLGRVRANS